MSNSIGLHILGEGKEFEFNIAAYEESDESEHEDDNNKSKEHIKQLKDVRKCFSLKSSFDVEDEDTGMKNESTIDSLHFKTHVPSTTCNAISELLTARIMQRPHLNENKAQEGGANEIPGDEEKERNAESDSESETTLLKMNKIEIKIKKNMKQGYLEEEIRQNVKEIKFEFAVEGDISDEEFFASTVHWNHVLSFQDMNLTRSLLKGISVLNYIAPTPIQQATIPIALIGKDICACTATESGKTAAYMLPVLERLLFKRLCLAPVTRVLCLVPTSELAIQVHSITQQLAQFTDVQAGLFAGGLDLESQGAALHQGPDVLVTTPGHLLDHLHNTPSFQLKSVEILILDEADRMLDEFFADQMSEIVELCSLNRQTMLFSATMTEKVGELAAMALKKPYIKLFINSSNDFAPCFREEFIRIGPKQEVDREAIVAALCSRTFLTNVLIFTQTKKQAHRMHIVLGLIGLKVAELHGDLNQAQRLLRLKEFKNAEVDILVCTDIAARDLDISHVETVINITLPNTIEHYVHRMGRIAWVGKTGRSVSLIGETEQKMSEEIIKLSKTSVRGRLVPYTVMERYKEKLRELDQEVQEVLRMEKRMK